MKTPYEFEQLAQSFLPHFNYMEPRPVTIQAWIAHVIKAKSASDRLISKVYLTAVLGSDKSDAELVQVWDGTSPIYWFHAVNIRAFLTELRDAL
jgi:hypothetical protein